MLRPSSLLALTIALSFGASSPGCRDTREPPPATQPVVTANANPNPNTNANVPSTAPSGPVRQHHNEVLAELDQTITAVLDRAETQPTNWLALDKAANLYLSRGRLTGSYDDYAQAETLVDRAFAMAGNGYGPFATRVTLNFTLHRLDRVARDLEAIAGFAVLTAKVRHNLDDQRAELAFQQGRYAEAQTGFAAALARDRNVTNLARMALYHWKTGDFLTAETLYHEALGLLRRAGGEPAAWLHLQLGLMDLERGRYPEALDHYRDGASELSGFWLLDEHMAEILTLLGHTDAALALYTDIIARTDNPEFMDAVAGIHRQAGREDLAKSFIDQARTRYEAQLARYPEAAYGHALDHFQEFGDPARAVTLAEANHRTRPNAEAKISLARAYMHAGRLEDARTPLTEALGSPWNTAELQALAAEFYEATGATDLAAAARSQALAIHPRIFE